VGTTLNVGGDAQLDTNLNVGSAATVGTTLNVVGAVTLQSSLSVSDGLFVSTNSIFHNDLYVSGALTVGGTVSFTGNASSPDATFDRLTINESITNAGTLQQTGAANLSDTLTVSGDATLGRNVTIEGWLHVNGDVTLQTLLTVTGATTFWSQVNFENGASGLNFQTTSDRRLKKDFEEIEGALAKVQALHPVFYNWNNGSHNINASCKDFGMIAQEVEAVFPNIVSTEGGEEGTKRIVYDRVAVLLVAAMKEQSAVIEDLRARVSALEA